MPYPKLICFGEVLWDLLPDGKVVGGAPLNVAYHASNLGLPAAIISKVGKDELGRELLAMLQQSGVSTELIQTDYTFPTGIVKVDLSQKSSAVYEIVQPVAWDYIHPDKEAETAVKKAEAFVFGSLACRKERTKKTLLQLLPLAALKIFDVNLRPPFYSEELLKKLLSRSDIVKMNEEELAILSGWSGLQQDETGNAQMLIRAYGLQSIILTKGADGAMYITGNEVFSQPGIPVDVEDTVGSGDSFLAAFICKMLDGQSPDDCLRFSATMGAIVATQKGGTPYITEQNVNEFMNALS